MKVNVVYGFLIFLLVAGCSTTEKNDVYKKGYIDYVNPLIGSGGHGHVFVGASIPHGMVQIGPNNMSKGWDWCSGYHDSDSTIIGFAHTHLSGTGIADLGDIIFMPVDRNKINQVAGNKLGVSDYVSLFQKEKQYVKPGYYGVTLDRYEIEVELTATARTGFHKYVYPENSSRSVIIDLQESVQSLEARRGTLDSYFTLVNDSTVAGYRYSDEWAIDHKVYFTSVFSSHILQYESYPDGKGVRVVLDFAPGKEPLYVKTGISYVSVEGATTNLLAELPEWNFDAVVNRNYSLWDDALSVIDFESDPESMTIFYTGLYHTMIVPSLFCDVDGKYRGADGVVREAEGFTPYTIFSLWDTYRAVHPLYTLIDTKVSDYVNTLLTITEEQGSLPVWHLAGNETTCMVGVHSIPVIVDACLKSFPNIDKERAYRAVSSIRSMDANGLDYVRNQKYIPADKISWSVARGLEYAIDDYCVAQLALDMGKEEEFNFFMERSRYYHHYFDPVTRFMRGKLATGRWRENYNPSYSLHLEDDYVEGNGWQYTWLVPHDVDGLIGLFGGKDNFLDKLDSLFLVSSDLNEGASIDISGMIGQYAHGNEPGHHTLYLYPYASEPGKAADKIRQVYKEFYHTSPDGLIGNEDCGQMSAWYIFSALGFYPVNPADGTFVFGSPLANQATIQLNNGNSFRIVAHNNSMENKYIQSVTLNGKKLTSFYLHYNDIMQGGILELEMGNLPCLYYEPFYY